MPELLGLPYSPWTEKARWALDARGVAYRFVHYQPLIGEPALRVKLRRALGKVSVPVLTDDDGRAIADSLEIARWADARGAGDPLVPREDAAAVHEWVARSERALDAGRVLSLVRVLADRDALLEMVPRWMRSSPGAARAIGAFGVRRTLRKYRGDPGKADAARAELASILDELRAAVGAAGARGTLLARFSFADIAMAQALCFVDPPARGLKIGRASRRAFTDDDLRARYADLLAWRDALYAKHRGAA